MKMRQIRQMTKLKKPKQINITKESNTNKIIITKNLEDLTNNEIHKFSMACAKKIGSLICHGDFKEATSTISIYMEIYEEIEKRNTLTQKEKYFKQLYDEVLKRHKNPKIEIATKSLRKNQTK
jgi:hypothetical protein